MFHMTKIIERYQRSTWPRKSGLCGGTNLMENVIFQLCFVAGVAARKVEYGFFFFQIWGEVAECVMEGQENLEIAYSRVVDTIHHGV